MTGKSRVLIVSGTYPDMKCGVAPHTRAVASALADADEWDVHVLTSRRPEIEIDARRRYELHPEVGSWGLSDLRAIARAIERIDPAVMHLQNPTAEYAARVGLWATAFGFLGACRRRRLVVTQHDFAIAHPLMKIKHLFLLSRAKAITVSNSRDFEAIRRLSTHVGGRTILAPHASLIEPPMLGPEERVAARNRMGLAEGNALIVFFGFIVPGRRIDTLVRATARLKERGLGFTLAMMGGPGRGGENYAESCRRLGVALGLGETVRWMGHVDDDAVALTLELADLFVAPIERGADFRNSTLISAMRAGAPILTTENPRYGVDMDLRACGACRFFPAGDPDSLADSIAALLSDSGARARMSAAGRETARGRTWAAHADALSRAYRGQA